MTILDAKLILGTNIDVGSLDLSSNTNIIGDIIDFGIGKDAFGAAATPNIGEGGDLELVIFCDGEDGAGAAATVLTFTLEHAAALNSGSTDLASAVVLLTQAISGVTASAADIGDEILRTKIPAGDFMQYAALRITASGGVPSAGMYSAFISMGHQSAK
jgi:hypothetical protein